MKHKLWALLLVAVLLLTGCSGEQSAETQSMEALFEKTAVSLEEGHLFFTGKVISVLAEKKMISFYEAETEKSTFYKVEITDDLFGCMPDRVVTVCVMGNSENFSERQTLEKEKEYIFDTTLWVQEEETVFLLPTFYESMPERAGDVLYYTSAEGRAMVDGSYQDYLDRLQALATENHYGPDAVLTAAKAQFESAAERDVAYFEELDFENVDTEALKKTNQFAEALRQRVENTENNWEGIKGLLQ